MAKYNIGDKVKITNGYWKDEVGVITEIISEEDEDFPAEYKVKINARGKKWPLTFDDNNLEKVDDNLFEEFLNKCQNESDDPFFEMATIKWGFMSIKLAIYSKEGNYPHFHFYKNLKPEGGIPEKDRYGGGCISIEEPKYFSHATHDETMTSKEIKGLIEFLKDKNKTFDSITNWQYIIGQWNDNNPDQKQLDINISIPEYKSDMEKIIEKHK